MRKSKKRMSRQAKMRTKSRKKRRKVKRVRMSSKTRMRNQILL